VKKYYHPPYSEQNKK